MREPRVAICFAGLPRLNPATMPGWRRFIGRYDADVFVHTWLEPNANRDRLMASICDMVNPRQLIIEQPVRLNTSIYSERIWAYRSEPRNVLSMWYSIKRSMELCMDWQDAVGVDYDIICRARFDWWFDAIDLMSNGGLTVPDDPGLSGHHFAYQGRPYVGHNDQFGYGSRRVMEEYSRTFDRIPWLYKDDGVDFCSELFLTANMIAQDIPVTYQTGINYRIVK